MLGKFFNWILGNKETKQVQDQITDSVTIQTETKVKKPRKPRSPNKKKKV